MVLSQFSRSKEKLLSTFLSEDSKENDAADEDPLNARLFEDNRETEARLARTARAKAKAAKSASAASTRKGKAKSKLVSAYAQASSSAGVTRTTSELSDGDQEVTSKSKRVKKADDAMAKGR